MDAPTLRLSNDDLRRVVGSVDAVEAVAAALIARSGDRRDWIHPETGSLTVSDGGEVAEYTPVDGGQRCAMPAAGLRDYRFAVLAVLAARNVLAPGVVTAAVIGSGPAIELHLAALHTHVPDVSHIALAAGRKPGQAVLDLLDSAGIGLTLVSTPADAVFGATLVVLVGSARLTPARLARGAVLVNTTGVDLPTALLDGVHEVYVDDPSGLADSDRVFARPRPARQRGRRQGASAVVTDLGQVLAGDHPGRTEPDRVLLVELIGDGAELDAILAGRIHQAAQTAGLGEITRN